MHNFPKLWLGMEGFKNPFANGAWRRVAPEPSPPYRPAIADEKIRMLCTMPRTRRGKLLLRLLAERGRRLGEVLGIRVCDVRDLTAGSGDKRVVIFKKTKSGREQFCVLSPQLATDLAAYIVQSELEGEAMVFPISQQAARACVNTAARKVGLSRFSPHDFRRHVATSLERSDVPLGVIKSFLGHSSSRVTERYIASRSLEELGGMS